MNTPSVWTDPARPLLMEYPGAVSHVMARGNVQSPIYLDDADQGMFLSVLGRVESNLNWLCHAYYLTTNHYDPSTISSSKYP